MFMTAFWCGIGYYLVQQPLIAAPIRNKAQIILPSVLIGLGIYIIISSLSLIYISRHIKLKSYISTYKLELDGRQK
jgi:cadmium resistance protein CadD (predicted permease)